MAVIGGFKPSLPGLLMLFATTLFGGYMIKKHQPESYDTLIKYFGLAVAGVNFLAGGMILMARQLPYVDRMSGAFLSFMVGAVIMTLLRIKFKKDEDSN